MKLLALFTTALIGATSASGFKCYYSPENPLAAEEDTNLMSTQAASLQAKWWGADP